MASTTEKPQRQLNNSDEPKPDQNLQGAEDRNQKAGTRRVSSRQPSGKLGKVSQLFINAGFVVALLLSVACLILSATYLFKFLASTNEGITSTIQSIGKNAAPGTTEVMINARLVMGRIALLSCGILVGISFGFLGFALFLLGIKESIDVDLDTDTYKAKFARMSPGVLIIVCSSILTGVCATRQTPFWYENTINTPNYSKQDDKRTEGEEDGSGPNQNTNVGSRDLPTRNKLSKP